MPATWVDGVTPLDKAHMDLLQSRDEKGAASGYASLDAGVHIPDAQMPTRLAAGPVSLGATDVNTLTSSGWYVVVAASPNLPASTDFYIQVIGYSAAGYCKQVAYEMYGGRSWMRTQNASVWSSWVQVADGLLLISDTKLASPTASPININSIPQTCKHLKLILSLRSTAAAALATASLRINGMTTGYLWTRNWGQNNAVGSASATSATSVYAGVVNAASGAGFSIKEILFADYAAAIVKHCYYQGYTVGDGLVANMAMDASGGYSNNTSPITQLSILLDAGNFDTGSRITLYGMN